MTKKLEPERNDSILKGDDKKTKNRFGNNENKR